MLIPIVIADSANIIRLQIVGNRDVVGATWQSLICTTDGPIRVTLRLRIKVLQIELIVCHVAWQPLMRVLRLGLLRVRIDARLQNGFLAGAQHHHLRRVC